MTEINPAIIKKTQEKLGKFIKKPQLTDKLLKKPPFRFLHDIIIVIIKENGFFKDLLTENEFDSANLKDRDAKIEFLQKIIDVVKLTTKCELDVKPSKIIAGLEPEQTNQLLQAIGIALEKKLDSSTAIMTVKNDRATIKVASNQKKLTAKKSNDPVNVSDSTKSSTKTEIEVKSKMKSPSTKEHLPATTGKRQSRSTKSTEMVIQKTLSVDKSDTDKVAIKKNKLLSKPLQIISKSSPKNHHSDSKSKYIIEKQMADNKSIINNKTTDTTPTKVLKDNLNIINSPKAPMINNDNLPKIEETSFPEKIITALKVESSEAGTTSNGISNDKTDEIDDGHNNNNNNKLSETVETVEYEAKTMESTGNDDPINEPTSNNIIHDDNKQTADLKSIDTMDRENILDFNKKEKPQGKSTSKDEKDMTKENITLHNNNEHESDFNASKLGMKKKSSKQYPEPYAQEITDHPISNKPPLTRNKSFVIEKDDVTMSIIHDDSSASNISPPQALPSPTTTTINEPKLSKPRTTLRPPSVRPASARPGAPRRRRPAADKNIEIMLEPKKEPPNTTGISVKIDSFNDELMEDDGENLIIIENSETINNSNNNNENGSETGMLVSNTTFKIKLNGGIDDSQNIQKGHLVQQILETQKEFSNLDILTNQQQDIGEYKTENSSTNARESLTSARHIDKLRDSIQKLTRSINPLGKLMDFLQEDIDSMQMELQMWQQQYEVDNRELKKEKSLSSTVLEPFKHQLVKIELNIKEQMELVNLSRANILQNNEKIYNLFCEL